MNFCAIPAKNVADFWPEISPGLENLLAQHTLGRWSSGDVLDFLLAGEWQLFIVSRDSDIVACLVCCILDGHKKTLEIGLCWGTDVDSWTDDVSQAFDRVAYEMGCKQLALDGRPGWRKIMRKFGFKLDSVRYTREISHGRTFKQ